MASKTYYVGFNGLIHRLDNLNFDPNGNTYTNWVNLRTYFDQSFSLNPQALGTSLWDVMTIPGNKDKVFVVGVVNSSQQSFKGIAYSTTAGQNTVNPNQSFITPGFPQTPSYPALAGITDFVKNWLLVNYELNTPFSFYEVWCVDTDTIYVCGDGGLVARSIDGGLNFTLHAVPPSTYFAPGNTAVYPQSFPAAVKSIHFESSDSGVAGSYNQVFLTTTGTTSCTWVSAAAVPANTGFIKGIYKKGNLIVAVGESKIICSLDGGVTWTFQQNWSEPIPTQSYPRNGEHLTWHYDVCSDVIYFRATGRRNEIYQTAYMFGTVNSFVDPITNAVLVPNAAWSVFNGHLFDPASGSSANPAKNYYAAQFYKPFVGFLGRTNVESAAGNPFSPLSWGQKFVDQFVTTTEILDVDQTPPNTKDQVLTAIWTDLDPVLYYIIAKCDGQTTYYVQEGVDTANITSLVNQTVNGLVIDGVEDTSCWKIEGPTQCGTFTVSDVNTLSAQILGGCNDSACTIPCYKLQNCQNPDDFIVVNATPALEDAIYQSVTLSNCPDKCWYVIPDWPCEDAVTLPGNITITAYKNCNDCLGIVETYDLRPRSVKPGFYTPGCPPDYTVKTSCMYAEQVYDEMVAIRYGITICCDHDVNKWDIKKQLLDLNALYNPELCTINTIECKEVCNLTATLSVTGPIQPYTPPPAPCKPPRFPNADLEPDTYCYGFVVKSDYPDYVYFRKLYLGYSPNEVEIDLTNIITVPVSSSLFPMQLTAALQSYGLQCSGVFYDPSGILTIYGFNANFAYVTFETIYGGNTAPPESFDLSPLNTECTDIPSTNCYRAYIENQFSLAGSYLGYLGIYNGTSVVQYDISSLGLQVIPAPLMPTSLPTLVTFVQSKGYDVDDITYQASGFGCILTFINFTGGIPVYNTYSGQIIPPSYNYFTESLVPCGELG